METNNIVASESGFAGSALAERALRTFSDRDYYRAYQRSRAMSLRYAVFGALVLITCLALLKQLPMLSWQGEKFLWLLSILSGGVLAVALLNLAGAWAQDVAIEHLANRRHRLDLMEEAIWHGQEQMRLTQRLQAVRQLAQSLPDERRSQAYAIMIDVLIEAQEDANGELTDAWQRHAPQLRNMGVQEELLRRFAYG